MSTTKNWGLFAVLCVIVLVINLLIITMSLNSFRSTDEILSEGTIIPSDVYRKMFQ